MRSRRGDDEELLCALQAGDRRATEYFLARHQGHVRRFAASLCASREDAEDVAQEALLAAVCRIRDFRAATSPRMARGGVRGMALLRWLHLLTRRICVARRRARWLAQLGPAGEVARDPAGPEGYESPEQAALKQERLAALRRVISRLAPPYRDVLLLHDVDGLSIAEVSRELGVTLPAVKNRLRRGRFAVRRRATPSLALP